MKIITRFLLTVSLFSFILASVGNAQVSPTVRNATNGAVLGGIIGGVVGHNSGKGNTKKGAIIGATAGAVLGIVNTQPAYRVNTGYPVHGGYGVNSGSLDAEIAQATREFAAEQAEADRIRAAYDLAQQRANEVRNRLYNLTSARDSLNAARR